MPCQRQPVDSRLAQSNVIQPNPTSVGPAPSRAHGSRQAARIAATGHLPRLPLGAFQLDGHPGTQGRPATCKTGMPLCQLMPGVV